MKLIAFVREWWRQRQTTRALVIHVLKGQRLILEGIRELMSGESDFKAELDQIRDGVQRVVAKVSAQAQTILDLQAQIAAGTPVTAEQLADLKLEAEGILEALAPATADPAPPTV